MDLADFLVSLTEAERDFIAGLDYGNDAERHRAELDIVIQNGGVVDFSRQLWFPYEVVELGKNVLNENHEREFTACLAIVLSNVLTGMDKVNDVEGILENSSAGYALLPPELRSILDRLIEEIIDKDR